MKYYSPDYYKDFSCIAHKCRHNCCIGWEIDIDEDTRKYYSKVGGELGKRIRRCISCDEQPHFILEEGGRCPFLNSSNLCDIILVLGEEALCDICADHPRYRHFYTDRTETGIGLSCEEAARIIITCKEKVSVVLTEDDKKGEGDNEEEARFIRFRQGILDILQDRKIGVKRRMEKMLAECGAVMPDFSYEEWAEIYRTLERLDGAWDGMFDRLCRPIESDVLSDGVWQTELEQLAVYFVFRHFTEGWKNDELNLAAAFCALSVNIIAAIFSFFGEKSVDTLIEIARMYSSEIEYSDENKEALLDILYDN